MENNGQEQKDLSKDINIKNENKLENIDISQNKEKEIVINTKNNDPNNDNKEKTKINQRNETINKFIEEMDKKNKDIYELYNKEDKESDDPFIKAENEYRINSYKNQELKEKTKKKDYSLNLRYKTEKEENSNKNTKKEKQMFQEIVYNHFKKRLNRKNINEEYKFQPKIFKNPERLYFNAVIENELNKLKMKSYNRKTGIFDLKKFQKTKENYLNQDKKSNNYFNSTKTSFKYNNYNTTSAKLKTLSFKNNTNSKCVSEEKNYNKIKKKNLIINDNILSNNSKKLNNINDENGNFFYTSISTNNPPKTLTTDLLESKKKTKINKNKKYIIKSANNKISSEKMRAYLIEYYKNKIKPKNSNHIKNKNNINHFLDSIDDPKNPYSIFFSRSLLKKYNLNIHYNKFEIERGVPLLTLKQSKNRFFSGKFFNETIKPHKRMAKTSYDNFPYHYRNLAANKNNKNSNNRYQYNMAKSCHNFYGKNK